MLTTKSSLAEQAVAYGSLQKISELNDLIDYLWDKELRTVVEIGTAKGGTFWLLCQLAADNATMISVDLVGGVHGPRDQRWATRKQLEQCGRRRQKIRLVRGDSHARTTLERTITATRGKPVDLLFIDGDHRYASVKKDFEMYSPLVRSGGLVVFHDIAEHEWDEIQVDQVWNEVKDGYVWHEFIHEEGGPWGGIGVLVN